jgi:hypothetical protein
LRRAWSGTGGWRTLGDRLSRSSRLLIDQSLLFQIGEGQMAYSPGTGAVEVVKRELFIREAVVHRSASLSAVLILISRILTKVLLHL